MTATTMTTPRPGACFPAPAGAVAHTGPLPRCPRCRAVLDGGPVAYRCAACGRGVVAADIDTDYHPRAGSGLPARASRAEEGSP